MLTTSNLASDNGTMLQLRLARRPFLIATSTTPFTSDKKDKKIPFGSFAAAEIWVGEKVRQLLKAKHLIRVHWNEIEDDVYDIAENVAKDIERVYVTERTSTDEYQNTVRTIKVSRPKLSRIEPRPTTITYVVRPAAETMSIAANRWLSKMMMKRKKARGVGKSRDVVIRPERDTKEVKGWSWNDETKEESWEDWGIEQHHAAIGWDEMCYREKPSVKAVTSFQPSHLRWSLTIREE